MNIVSPEIVINSTLVSNNQEARFYEFILRENLDVMECGYVESLSEGVMHIIDNAPVNLHGYLFELNHVRVNPHADNNCVLNNLAEELQRSGVEIYNQPSQEMMAMCFKPLGELSDIVRFYINAERHLVFLSSSVKLFAVE